MTMDNVVPGPAERKVVVRSFDDIAGYEHSMRLATAKLVVREAPNFNGWHARIDLGRVRLNSAEYSASLSSSSTVRWPRFFFLSGNRHPARVSGQDFDRGMINYMAENGPVSMVSHKHMAWTSIEFAPELLTTDLEALSGRSGFRFDHGAMFHPGGTAAWTRLIDVCRTALRVGMTDAAGFDPKAAATAAAGVLIEAATGCLSHGAPEVDRAAARRHHVILRRMIDTIENDHRTELTVASLCQAANVSAPTLHEISMNYLGVPPAHFLRCHRLTRVNALLRDAAPDSLTVAAAMSRNGIWEHDRAAVTYEALFGQTPADTLNKVPRFAIVQKRAEGLPRKRA